MTHFRAGHSDKNLLINTFSVLTCHARSWYPRLTSRCQGNRTRAAVRLRLPNGRPATAQTASTSAVHGWNHVVAPNALADVFLSATCSLSALGFGRGKVGDARENCVE